MSETEQKERNMLRLDYRKGEMKAQLYASLLVLFILLIIIGLEKLLSKLF